ncbi:serine hydrolase domain-containing protein [Pseudoduganella lutea]|nr:serine hydrolase domain-containing protein [Pseudoduganella lutea]
MQGSVNLEFFRTALLSLGASFLAGCASFANPGPMPASGHGSVHEILPALAEHHRVCNVVVAVVRNRKLHSIDSASGCKAARPPGPDSVFQAASLSKPLFAHAVLLLAKEGRIELEAPVMRYLPEGYLHRYAPLEAEPSELVTDHRLNAITVRMALNHTSGLPNWSSGPLRFDTAPGAKWDYSGEGYVFLQRAVEAVTGQPLDRFMASGIFQSLGMQHSDYVLGPRIARDLVPGTKANGAPRATIEMTSPVAAFSLHTTANDYARFLVAVLADQPSVDVITASPVTVDAKLDLGWGLGWGIARERDDTLIWQWGNNPGYRAFVIASVRSGDGMVMLTNSENGLKLAEPLTRRILPGEHALFRSAVMGTDVLTMLCNGLKLCL